MTTSDWLLLLALAKEETDFLDHKSQTSRASLPKRIGLFKEEDGRGGGGAEAGRKFLPTCLSGRHWLCSQPSPNEKPSSLCFPLIGNQPADSFKGQPREIYTLLGDIFLLMRL